VSESVHSNWVISDRANGETYVRLRLPRSRGTVFE
jgi:hypothetical protein